MIEVSVSGGYVERPHHVGAWAYLIQRNDLLVGQGQGSGQPAAVASRLAAETAALCLALEDLTREWYGDEVVVRTASASLQGLLSSCGQGARPDVARWYERLVEAAERCARLQLLVVAPRSVAVLQAVVQKLLPCSAKAPHGFLGVSHEKSRTGNVET